VSRPQALPKRPIRKVLVANRGEIAVRIIRTLRDMGIGSVAVYSEADRGALHVRLADEAREIGAPPPSESYLRIDRIIDAARAAGADAIHPGYGFLAENAEFAAACEAAGLAFIGPPPEAIRAMGEKTAARERMRAAGVPVIPGSDGTVADLDAAAAAARAIGFPILVKAAHGGGGRGMRVARSEADLAPAFRQTTSEAASAFGRGEVFVERWIERPRHVEVQVLADAHGAVVHLGERECSIQRRHQKLVEESPSVAVSPALREEMGRAAVRAAAAVGYRSAGTVEFLLDAGGTFYFLEMNTRLQVEHPVTEMVTGLDLVREQVRIAEGAPLGFRQEEIAARGWAIECRVTAEDPERAFAPSAGTIRALRLPEGPGVRNDMGVAEGSVVPVFYDSLLAKLVVWGATRDEAIARLRRALGEYVLVGVPTSLPFHRFVVEDEAFRAGDLSTAFVEERFAHGGKGESVAGRGAEAAASRSATLAAADRESTERVAALAAAGAAFFLRARRGGVNGGAGSAGGFGRGGLTAPAAARGLPSAWRAAARAEAMRRPGRA